MGWHGRVSRRMAARPWLPAVESRSTILFRGGLALTTAAPAVWTRVTTGTLALGGVHALVDAASGYVIFADLGHAALPRSEVIALVVLYTALAFGGQAPAGLVADRWRCYRGMAIAGVLLAALALPVATFSALAGVVVVGIGNALFHVGAGAHVLRVSGDRATESGVFVGPGAVGLAAGIWFGLHGVPVRYAIAVLLLGSGPVLASVARSRVGATPLPRLRSGMATVAVIAAACLLASVFVRSLGGGTVAWAWRGVSEPVLMGLALAACCGKMAGGFVADRVGWATSSALALVIAAPLISLLVDHAAFALAGMVLFQMTMPVTLKAMHHLLPQRPGLAFGIPCAALLLGALPGLLGLGGVVSAWPRVLGLTLLSLPLVVAGLVLLVRLGGAGGPRPDPLLRRYSRGSISSGA